MYFDTKNVQSGSFVQCYKDLKRNYKLQGKKLTQLQLDILLHFSSFICYFCTLLRKEKFDWKNVHKTFYITIHRKL